MKKMVQDQGVLSIKKKKKSRGTVIINFTLDSVVFLNLDLRDYPGHLRKRYYQVDGLVGFGRKCQLFR